MKHKISLASLLVCFGLPSLLFAQPSVKNLQKKANASVEKIDINPDMPAQASMVVNGLSRTAAQNWLATQLQLRSGTDALKQIQATPYVQNTSIDKLQQYYKGIKVEHGIINIISRNGAASYLQMEFYPVADNFIIAPALTEAQAFDAAVATVQAKKYMWEAGVRNSNSYTKPQGELVIIQDMLSKPGQMCLAYKFDIYAAQPLSRSFIYINAATGKKVFEDIRLKHANATGTAATRYSGTQTIITDNASGNAATPYRLKQTRNGHVINTYNAFTGDYFEDNDNNWTAAEYNNDEFDNAALDVQYAMQLISDYWKTIHNRNSWDNAFGDMDSYVHEGDEYNNAYWSGSDMHYGDGSFLTSGFGFKPLTSLDVSGHELGHAVCQGTADLAYVREAGALNEGFSDIWGACLENFSGLPKSIWQIGEEISAVNGDALRNMQNPNIDGQPDTYKGNLWEETSIEGCPGSTDINDHCGVHNNSGVINKWFYLVTQGESGTNDNGDNYVVTGIGFAKSQVITFLGEQSLTPDADYADARNAMINAATTLYGACSNEVIQVTNAWYAVGVGGTAGCTPQIEFITKASTTTESDIISGATCAASKQINIPVRLGAVATQATNVTLNVAGTAILNQDYTISSNTISYAKNESGIKNIVLSILDDATIDGSKTIVLSYTVNANGGNAAAGIYNQKHTLTITDNELAPPSIQAAPITAVTLLNESFDGVVFGAANTNWNVTNFINSSNVWTVGNNGGTGITGAAAYITNNTTTKPLAYNNSSEAQTVLRTPLVPTIGQGNLQLKFKYKMEGENLINEPGSEIYDYGKLVYSFSTGGNFNDLPNAKGDKVGTLILGDGNNAIDFAPFELPSNCNNKASLYIGFEWINDGAAGDIPPLLIDNVVLTGLPLNKAVETQVGQPATVNLASGTNTAYIYSAADTQTIAKIQNPSIYIPCLKAELTEAGAGSTAITSDVTSFLRSKKVVQFTGTASAATYKLTLYYTTAELQGWGNAATLKVLKITGNAPLTSIITAATAQILTPTIVNNTASTGVMEYTVNVTGLSAQDRFMLVSNDFALPLKLQDFAAALHNSDALLTWSTTNEANNKGFDVLKSYDGSSFTKIGVVAGINKQVAAYSFTDKNLLPNQVNYYRLRQLDKSGKISYSNIATVKRAANAQALYSLFPNPVKDRLFISLSAPLANITVTITNPAGQKLIAKKFAQIGTQLTIPMSSFAAGAYFVQVASSSGVENYRVIKE